MNRTAGMATLLALLLPGLAAGAEISADGTTIVRVEERSVPGFSKQTIAPATQFLGLDMNDVGAKGLSLHFYGWGRVDLADDSGVTTDPQSTDGDFSYGYLQYRFEKGNAAVKAGRFFVYEGVATEQIDGVYGRTDLNKGFTLAAYAGAPVKLQRSTTTASSSDSKGDFIGGGRLGFRYGGILDIGVSGLTETGSPYSSSKDPQLNKDDRQLFGGDIWLAPHRTVEIAGRTSYNATTSEIAEHSYSLSYRPVASLTTVVSYTDIQLQDYFSFTNTPKTLFNPDINDTYQATGVSASYRVGFMPVPTDITLDYKHYNRDTTGSSDRYAGELRLKPSDKVTTGLAFARVEAAQGIMSFSEPRAYVMYSTGPFSVNLDTIADFYDDPVYNKDYAYEVTGGCGYQLTPMLRLSGEATYAETPQYDSETRALVRLTFAYTNKKGAAQ